MFRRLVSKTQRNWALNSFPPPLHLLWARFSMFLPLYRIKAAAGCWILSVAISFFTVVVWICFHESNHVLSSWDCTPVLRLCCIISNHHWKSPCCNNTCAHKPLLCAREKDHYHVHLTSTEICILNIDSTIYYISQGCTRNIIFIFFIHVAWTTHIAGPVFGFYYVCSLTITITNKTITCSTLCALGTTYMCMYVCRSSTY